MTTEIAIVQFSEHRYKNTPYTQVAAIVDGFERVWHYTPDDVIPDGNGYADKQTVMTELMQATAGRVLVSDDPKALLAWLDEMFVDVFWAGESPWKGTLDLCAVAFGWAMCWADHPYRYVHDDPTPTVTSTLGEIVSFISGSIAPEPPSAFAIERARWVSDIWEAVTTS